MKDPALAERLVPRNHGFGTRRVPLETNYYEAYNQPNVRLVDLRETPIRCVTPAGVETSAEQHALDLIVYATGFDAVTGPFTRIDIRGEQGLRLRDAWRDGPRTHLGLQFAGFPNLFAIIAPHNAAAFCIMPRCIEQNVDWVSACLAHLAQRPPARAAEVDAVERAGHDVEARCVHEHVERVLRRGGADAHVLVMRTIGVSRRSTSSTFGWLYTS